MSWGFLFFIILFIIGVFIWASGEGRRRDAMTPEQRKALEDEEQFGEIDEAIECIYCHKKNCVRTRTDFEHAIYESLSTGATMSPSSTAILTARSMENKRDLFKARCMKCGSYWDMFDPHAEDKS